MKLFDLDKWERDGKAELDAQRAKQEDAYNTGSGKPHTWVLVTTSACLVASAVFLGANGFFESKGIGDFGTVELFTIGAALMALIGVAYAVSIVAGRTAATSRSMSLAENVITMVCSIAIVLASALALFYRLTM